ncbi:MAG TPA: GNAT family N-acetyltransferase [Pyrinomonadaceae bacterium]|jgi:ribosomal protein S18 acetylase RimI-like enzyme|nr:GNAT family N-acetyltransferase [Pyrinomonadaceae bacterium]
MLQTSTVSKLNERDLSTAMAAVQVERLTNNDAVEVLQFLAQRPIHTVAMMSLIHDNGVVSPFNRGTFYGYRDLNGQLEGVALVGHATLMETISDRALAALAQVARECPTTHLIMGERERVADFWSHYSETGRRQRLACREWLFELTWPVEAREPVIGLRPAQTSELELVMPVQAQLAFAESGINPMQVDPQGFRERCLRRIEQGRTWVVVEDSELIFKADVISKTAEVVYIEGVWLREDCRHQNLGTRFMSELLRRLLEDTKSICLLVNETNEWAQGFYRKCGFHFRATYETIFLLRKEQVQN